MQVNLGVEYINIYLQHMITISYNNNKYFNIDKKYYIVNSRSVEEIINLMIKFDMYTEQILYLAFHYINELAKNYIITDDIYILLFVTCLMIANKYLEDVPFDNKTYSRLINMNIYVLNELEIEIIKYFDYNLTVSMDQVEKIKNKFINIITNLV